MTFFWNFFCARNVTQKEEGAPNLWIFFGAESLIGYPGPNNLPGNTDEDCGHERWYNCTGNGNIAVVTDLQYSLQ
jgi:hypothetical protein